jgi:transposase
MLLKYALGLDISSKKIDCCFSSIDRTQAVKAIASTSITNDLSGFRNLVTWVQKHQKEQDVAMVVNMEATGVYYENCALYLFQNGFAVCVVLPNKSQKYFAAIGHKSKNDKIDAKGLARMAAEQSLSLWQPMGDFFYTLRTYTRQHQNLQEQKTVVGNQLHALERGMYRNKVVEKQLSKMIQLIEKQIEEVEQTILDHLESNEKVFETVQNICKIKGVGTTTIATLLAETNGFLLFENSKQLVSYAGYDVVENQSGSHIGKTKISKKGNSRIRRALFMPAFLVVRHKQGVFENLYERTLKKHGIKMKSYVAVQKKLLTTVYALYKSNKPFDNDFHKKNSHANDVTTQGKHTNELTQHVSSTLIQK